MREHKYILEGHVAVPCSDLMKWAEQCERRHVDFKQSEYDPWRVARDEFKVGDSNVSVSTVFLGVDHSWNDGPPIIFETMIFGFTEGHPLHDYQDRCSTWEEAEDMHQKACDQLKEMKP